MSRWIRNAIFLASVFVAAPQIVRAQKAEPYTGPACAAPVDPYFANEVWPKVGLKTCLECHKTGGDAEDSRFILLDPLLSRGEDQDRAMRHNRDAFGEMARIKAGDESRLLLKVVGKLKHGGKQVLKPDSAGYTVLAEFVRRLYSPSAQDLARMTAQDKNAPPFFDGVVMLSDKALLRRVTLSLAGRLPTEAELAAVSSQGRKAFPELLDAIMKDDAFYARLREGFNDIFLTTGYDDVPEHALSYEHFSKTRGWTEYGDFSSIKDKKERDKYKFKLTQDYRKAFQGEPMKLIEYIVRNDHPFSEIVTADYIMVTPYTAKGYGIFDELKDKFKNPDDPFEYIPVRLKKLVSRDHNGNDDEDSPTGYYAHAGLLSNFQYLTRYPTTETNRNRARARVFYLYFLGVDVLELAARVSDAAAVTAKFPNATMEAPECVVCHKTVDPVAGCFQDYWKFKSVYGRRKGGWFKDMFAAGFEGEDLPADQRWRALQWLGEKTVKDPRFATAMVGHVYYILTGRKVLQPPKDIDDPHFDARRRAYQEQRKEIEAIATHFVQSNFNLRVAFKDLILCDFYRADGFSTATLNPERQAELDDIGIDRMLAPEQVERKVKAIFGQPWGHLSDQMAMLYGDIDSKEVTERASDPSGAMGAIQRTLSNDVALRETALDFSRPDEERRLFRGIEPDVVPGESKDGDAKIRREISFLHQLILGREDAPDSAEVQRTFELFAGIVSDAQQHKGWDPQELYGGRQKLLKPVPDPKYTVRAWRAVLTYLMRRPEFLYE